MREVHKEEREEVERKEKEAEEQSKLHPGSEVATPSPNREAEFSNESWMYGVNLDSYEDFTIKRTWRIIKVKGAEHFKLNELKEAERLWLGGVTLVNKVGLQWPTATELYVQLKCNLAQLYLKQERWVDAKNTAASALDVDPMCEKALYRRALAFMSLADWTEAKKDFELLLCHYPGNVEATRKLLEVKEAIRAGAEKLKGVGVRLSNAIQELTPDGTLRKLAVLVPGPEEPADPRWTWPWGMEEWLGPTREKAVLTVHVVVRSVGGQELFSTRERLLLPQTPAERDELRVRMQEVAELDDKAGKAARSPAEFYRKEALHPMRWRYGDPSVYAGFELAARSMRLGEKALFEIDQPLLEPSVCGFYNGNGNAARAAGLPRLQHHVEEKRLELLAEELTEWELDLESKVQRTVRAELELLNIELYRDLSPERTGDYLVSITSVGSAHGRPVRRGMKVLGDFVISGALDGSALYSVERAVWVLGNEGQESFVDRHGQQPIWVPLCVGKVVRDANWSVLHEGARLEARIQAGPSPMELNPRLARDLNWKRAWGHRPPASVSVVIHEILTD